MMLPVVPLHERSEPHAGIGLTAKTLWEGRMIFERLELRFRKRIVIRNVRARMAFDHPQVGQQQRQGFGGHRAAVVGMNGQLVRRDVFTLAGLGNQNLGQVGRLALGDPLREPTI